MNHIMFVEELALRSHYVMFIQAGDCECVLRKLISSGLLCSEYLDKIKSGKDIEQLNSEVIKVATTLIKRNGIKYFNDFLAILYSEKLYIQFVTSVIKFTIIYKNRYLIIKGLNATVINQILSKHQIGLLGCRKKNDYLDEDYFLELMETKLPEFHVELFKLLTTNKSYEKLLNVIFKNIEKQHLPLMHIIKTFNICTECLYIFEANTEHNTDEGVYISSNLPHETISTQQGTSIQGTFDHNIDKDIRIFFDSVKNSLNKPTTKHLASYVIPYCAPQWKILGDILGIPPHTINIIEKDHHYVEVCCRELLHTWLQQKTEASWKTLLCALNSPAFHCTFTREHFVFSSLSKFQKYLKSVYIKQKLLTNDDWPPMLHSHFIELPLARVPKEISRPKFDSSLLFTHEKKDYEMEILSSYVQMFQYHQDEDHQVMVIEGNPGSGKTTLSYKICKDWAEDIILKDISLIILCILRDPRVSNATTLDDLIRLESGSRAQAEEISNDLTISHGKNVIIWLEGWDELEYSKRSDSLFTDLISCRLLPEAIIVVTTRPVAYETIKQSAITQKIEILQFTEELVNEYIDVSFHETPSNKIKFKHEINRVPSASSLTHNPMCLTILLHVFVMSYNHTLPETLTEIYEKFLLMSIHRHNIKVNNDKTVFININKLPPKLKEFLHKLGKLAYENLCDDQLVFSCDKVSEIVFSGEAVPADFNGMCLLEVHDVEQDIGIIKNYNFLHKSVQELLAAVYLMNLENIQQDMEMKKIFGNEKFNMVWLFYGGLTKLMQMNIKTVFPSLFDTIHATTVNSKALELFTCYKKFDMSFYSSNDYSNSLHSLKIISQNFLITLVLCCYEAKCPMLCSKICSHFFPSNTCFIYVPHSAATQQTMVALSFFVAHSNKNCALQCQAPVPNGIHLLCSYLKQPKEACGRLWRLAYSMSIRDIHNLLYLVHSRCYLQSLTLPYSVFSYNDIVNLCNTLKHNQTLLKLDLTGCGITGKELEVISELLQVNITLQYLAITDNQFCAVDFIAFVRSLQNNSRLQEVRVDAKHQPKFSKEVTTEYIEENFNFMQCSCRF